MNKLLCAILLLALTATHAPAQKGINGVIKAEKDFAAYAIEHNTKEAFLHFLDSANGLVFNDGKTSNAYTTWSGAGANTNKLIWEPAFAGVSNGGDLGFTTGPWQLKHSLQDASLANGQYTTIWHLNEKGEWKFLVDIGITFNDAAYAVDSVRKWGNDSAASIDGTDAIDIDKAFITQYQTMHNDAFTGVLLDDSWFNIQGQRPITGKENIINALSQTDPGMQFIPMGGGIASSNDLAYVYGIVRAGEKQENYLRIWQKTRSGNKLLLQVLKL